MKRTLIFISIVASLCSAAARCSAATDSVEVQQGATTCLSRAMSFADGRLCTNFTIIRIEPDGVSIRHPTGITKLPFERLSEDEKLCFHLDSASALHYREQQRIANAAYDRRMRDYWRTLNASRPVPRQHSTTSYSRSSDVYSRSSYHDHRTKDLNQGRPVRVSSYTRRDGTFVREHTRNSPMR